MEVTVRVGKSLKLILDVQQAFYQSFTVDCEFKQISFCIYYSMQHVSSFKNVQLISNNPLSNNVNRYGKAPHGMVEEVMGTGQCWKQNVGHLCVTQRNAAAVCLSPICYQTQVSTRRGPRSVCVARANPPLQALTSEGGPPSPVPGAHWSHGTGRSQLSSTQGMPRHLCQSRGLAPKASSPVHSLRLSETRGDLVYVPIFYSLALAPAGFPPSPGRGVCPTEKGSPPLLPPQLKVRAGAKAWEELV